MEGTETITIQLTCGGTDVISVISTTAPMTVLVELQYNSEKNNHVMSTNLICYESVRI